MERNMLLGQWNVGAVDLYNVFRFPVMYFRDFSVVAQIFLFQVSVSGQWLKWELPADHGKAAESLEVCIAQALIRDGAHSTMSAKPWTPARHMK